MKFRLCLIAALMVVLTAVIADAATNWDSPFGLNGLWPGTEETGTKWVRCGDHLGSWPDTEQTNGNYNWTSADAELQNYKTLGITPLPIAAYTPAWARTSTNLNAPPDNVLEYTEFFTALTSRYKADVSCWEIWNEENDKTFFYEGIGQYSDLLKAGYVGAKTGDPNCKVLLGGMAGVDTKWLERIYERGGKDYFDVAACHPYQWGTFLDDNWFINKLTALRNLMNSKGDSFKEIWLTELGWSVNDPKISEDLQARLLAQVYVTALSLKDMGVTRIFWYNCKDWSQGYGLVRDDSTRRPAFTAYSTLTGSLEGATYKGKLSLGSDVRAHLFQAIGGKGTIVVWAPSATTITLSDSVVGPSIICKNYLGVSITPTHDSSGWHIQADTGPIYISNCATATFAQAVKPTLPAYNPTAGSSPQPLATWMSFVWPENTDRPFVVAGNKSPVQVRVFNSSSQAVSGTVKLQVSGMPSPADQLYSVGANSNTIVTFQVNIPAGASGLYNATATADANGQALHTAECNLRATPGDVIEFLAGSYVENKYVYDAGTSGLSEAARWGSQWTYKFDLTKAERASIDLTMGANAADPWTVQMSSDNVNWTTVLSGASWPSVYTVDLGQYCGSQLYIKFNGMLYETILTSYLNTDCVKGNGPLILASEPLIADWTTYAPDATISEYFYCVGTTPGASDVVALTSVGKTKSISLSDLSLVPWTKYYITVKAKDSSGLWRCVGSTPGTMVIPTTGMGNVHNNADTKLVSIPCAIVTAGSSQFANAFYVEAVDRSSGIKVSSSSITADSGDLVSINGTIGTQVGERYITNSSVVKYATAMPVPSPLGMSGKSIGGSSPNGYTFGVYNSVGLYNVGLLVRLAGRVTFRNITSKFFYVDDGSNRLDGSGYVGIKVSCLGLASGNTISLPDSNAYVAVTGVVSTQTLYNKVIPVIRPRAQSDIVTFSS